MVEPQFTQMATQCYGCAKRQAVCQMTGCMSNDYTALNWIFVTFDIFLSISIQYRE